MMPKIYYTADSENIWVEDQKNVDGQVEVCLAVDVDLVLDSDGEIIAQLRQEVTQAHLQLAQEQNDARGIISLLEEEKEADRLANNLLKRMCAAPEMAEMLLRFSKNEPVGDIELRNLLKKAGVLE